MAAARAGQRAGTNRRALRLSEEFFNYSILRVITAYGGISIECSAYSRLRNRMREFTILSDAELSSSDRFQFLKLYPVTFMPTLV